MISIAVDFDGTLCEDRFPYIGEPKFHVINAVKKLQELGVKTVLWTCRNGEVLREAVIWCHSIGLHFDAVNENLKEVQQKWGGDTRKVLVDYYLDDKNLGSDYEFTNLRHLIRVLELEKGAD